MIIALIRDRRWVPLAVLGGGATVHGGMWAGRVPCPGMSLGACLAASTVIAAGASLAAIAARAGLLGLQAAREVGALPRVRLPGLARAAARRAGARRVTCVRGGGPAMFCAGLWRPRIYLTDTAARALSPAELGAVFAHEAAHARRHDPVRRLAARAAADVLSTCRWQRGGAATRPRRPSLPPTGPPSATLG